MFFWFLLIQIRNFEKKRQELNQKLKKDINASKMFIPVAIVLFLCNIGTYTCRNLTLPQKIQI